MSSQPLSFGPFTLDALRGSLLRDGKPMVIGNKGLLLLRALLEARGRPVSKADLMDAVWPGIAVEDSNLSVQIAAVRKMIGSSPEGIDWITTIPRLGYRLADGAGRADHQPNENVQPPTNARPTIAVLPFANMSGDSEQDYLADGITEDIITALTRLHWFFVIDRNTSFTYKGRITQVKQIALELGVRYVLEGSIRKSAQRVRISVQLVDAVSGNHIWAERYDLELTDVFAVQDEIAERVAGAIEPELLRTESATAVTRHTGNMTAWDLVRRGTWYFHQVTRDTHLHARELFRQATALDPDLPEAHIWLARVSAGLIPYGWSVDPKADLREGKAAALTAIRLDERNPYSHYGLAIVSVYAHEFDQATRAAEKTLEISPSFALGYLVLGMARLFNGQASEAVAPLEHGLRLSPFDPQNFVWFNVLAMAHLFGGASQRALDCAVRALKIRPAWPTTLETMTCCHAASGSPEKARACVEQMRNLERLPGDIFAPLKAKNANWATQLTEMLRDAGWNE